MSNYYDYIIADLRLRSTTDLVALGLRGFKPFEASVLSDAEVACTFSIDTSLCREQISTLRSLSTTYLAEAKANGELFKSATGYLYTIERQPCEAILHIDTTTRQICCNLEPKDSYDLSLLRFGIWMMFGVVLAHHSAIAIHSSVIESEGYGVLFLGESGTGKSTHTRLWRENIEGAHLLNDDSPIVRIIEDRAMVYGSPWSGKTPCYKSLSYPIAGFCRLSQAPHNKIRKLPTIAAIGALLPSCPPQFAHDEELQDCICSTLGKLLRNTPAYHLECLPDSAAAHLSHSTIIGNAQGSR